MKNYIVETGRINKDTGKMIVKGFDDATEAIRYADKVRETTGNYPTIRKAVYQTITQNEMDQIRRTNT